MPDPRVNRLVQTIGGEVSRQINLSHGCCFSPRCPHETTVCQQTVLQLQPDDNKPYQTAHNRLKELNETTQLAEACP